MTDFDEFVEKKRLKLPNRRYEYKYPKNVDLIKKLLQECLEKRTSTMWSLYSYRSIAEYLYDECQMHEATKEGLRRAIARIAKEYELEL